MVLGIHVLNVQVYIIFYRRKRLFDALDDAVAPGIVLVVGIKMQDPLTDRFVGRM